MKVSEAVEEFLLDQSCRGNTKQTLKAYRTILSYFIVFTDDRDVCRLDLALCRRYYKALVDSGVSSTTIQTYIRHVRAFLRWLYDSEFMETNICHKFRLPKATRPTVDVLTNDELARIFAVYDGNTFLDIRNRTILALFLDSGLRLSELVTIRLGRMHVSERYVIVDGKGNKQRAVPFGNSTQSLLRCYMEFVPQDRTYLFLQENNEPITVDTLKDMFRRLKEAAAVPRLHPHLLRHTFATRYLENGGNIYALQSILGHTSLEMVKRYLHLSGSGRIRKEFVNFSPLDCFSAEKR